MKGIYSFGLMETNLYDRAEKLAKEVGGPFLRCGSALGERCQGAEQARLSPDSAPHFLRGGHVLTERGAPSGHLCPPGLQSHLAQVGKARGAPSAPPPLGRTAWSSVHPGSMSPGPPWCILDPDCVGGKRVSALPLPPGTAGF